MTSNTHKRLDKLQREITDLGSKGRALGDTNETAEAKLERMKAEGSIVTGDEYQLIQIPWAISELEGSAYIPEGNSTDPFAEPPLPPVPQLVTSSWGEERERDQKWKDHLKSIEAKGERFDPDKPKRGGVY